MFLRVVREFLKEASRLGKEDNLFALTNQDVMLIVQDALSQQTPAQMHTDVFASFIRDVADDNDNPLRQLNGTVSSDESESNFSVRTPSNVKVNTDSYHFTTEDGGDSKAEEDFDLEKQLEETRLKRQEQLEKMKSRKKP